MSYSIRYLPLAVEDLDALAAYLSRFYPGTAGRVLGEIENRISSLQERPHQCEAYKADPFFRRAVISDYLIFYHINDDIHSVDIHRILRGSWSLSQHLPPSEL